ncbi:MAG: Bax inhibitor-1/YccA family protein [Planctomycetota bacterium]
MRSGNPTLQHFEQPQRWDDLGNAGAIAEGADMTGSESDRAAPVAKQMTLNGTILATGTLLAVCAASAVAGFSIFEGWIASGNLGRLWIAAIGGAIGSLVLGLIMNFKPRTAQFLGFPYAVLEGGFLAAISLVLGARYLGMNEETGGVDPALMGVIYQAILLTFGIGAGLLIAYASGLVRLGNTAIKIVMVAGAGVMVYGIAVILLNGLLGMGVPNLFASASPLGIGFSAVLVVLASVFLVLDFQLIDDSIKAGMPKHFEWYAGFSVLATLAWIYVEVLRLLLKLRSSD